MKITTNEVEARGIKFTILESNREIARAYLYFMYNDLHSKPFGFLEDVYVTEDNRGRGLGTELIDIRNSLISLSCFIASNYNMSSSSEHFNHV